MAEFTCCKKPQQLIDYVDRVNGQKYQYGQCQHCKKRFLKRGDEEIIGRRAKELWGRIRHKVRQDISKHDKYRPKAVMKDNFNYAVGGRKIINGKEIDYQIAKFYISGYSTGFNTLESQV